MKTGSFQKCKGLSHCDSLRCAREFGKPLRPFKQSDMNRLVGREWKGNIRELAHLVEQAVIVSDGDMVLQFLGFGTGEVSEGAGSGDFSFACDWNQRSRFFFE